MMRFQTARLPALLIAGGLLLASCQPPQPTRYYTLATVTPEESLAGRTGEIVLGLGPINLPDYLDRPDIVTRENRTRLVLSTFNQWGESLGSLFSRVLREDLVTLLDSQEVVLLPTRRMLDTDFDLEVDVLRFEAQDDGMAVLDARWRLYDRGGERLRRTEQTVIEEPVASISDYNEVAASMSRAVGRLAATMAEAIAAER